MSGEKLGSHSKLWGVTEHYRVRGGNRVPDPKRRSRTAKHNQADSQALLLRLLLSAGFTLRGCTNSTVSQ